MTARANSCWIQERWSSTENERLWTCRSRKGRTNASELPDEPVARAMHGSKVRRLTGVQLQLLPQTKDVGCDGSRSRIGAIVPHVVQQFTLRNDASFVVQEKCQHLEFLRGHPDRDSLPEYFHTQRVDLNFSEAECIRDRCT